jgi:hypothetical protein
VPIIESTLGPTLCSCSGALRGRAGREVLCTFCSQAGQGRGCWSLLRERMYSVFLSLRSIRAVVAGLQVSHVIWTLKGGGGVVFYYCTDLLTKNDLLCTDLLLSRVSAPLGIPLLPLCNVIIHSGKTWSAGS